MLKETITISDAIKLLNDMLCLDSGAVDNLMESRVFCNKAIADHASIQVICCGDKFNVGILGVLNGLFGSKNGYGPITAVYCGEKIIKFKRTEATMEQICQEIMDQQENGCTNEHIE